MLRYVVLAGLAAFIQTSGAQGCAVGGKCLTPPEGSESISLAAGDTVPQGQGQVLLNSEYYGLPPAEDGAWYYRVGDQIVRVRPQTLEVIEDVTDRMNRAF